MADRCASCGTWLTPGVDFCDVCSAPVASSRRAQGGGAARPSPSADDDLELDLDLPESPAPPPSRRPRPRSPQPSASSADAAGLLDDPLQATEPGPALELDLPPSARKAAAARSLSNRPGPGGGGEGPRKMAVYDAEVQRLAEYGPAPGGIFGAIPYTLHVIGRRRELRAGRRAAEQARVGAESAARRTIMELGRELFARAATLDLGEVASQLEGVRRVSGHLDARTREQTEAHAEMTRRRANIGERLQGAQADANPWRDKETKLATQLEVREAELKRAQAKLKRIEIELRNLAQASSAGDGVAAPDRLATLEASREARRAEVAAAEVPVRQLGRDLAEVRRELATRVEVVAQIEEERRAAEDEMRRIESLHTVGANEASRELDEALLALGEEAHLRGLDKPLGPLAARAESALVSVEQRRRTEELYRRAIDAYHEPTFKKGAAILAGAAFVVLLMIAFLVVK